ncbi:MAG TPA: L-2-hydroxyglutarate oxidase [Phycisphaerales bacterium]|nr:L-2-hydroxyglutarate oxidase [Phycisphaerales bacterium]
MSGRLPIVVVGGGIVGLATAWTLLIRHPGLRVVVLEKEDGVARHQSGHNSGVIHSGVYYKPGSLKAINCRRGKRMLEEFCSREGIRFRTCGKVIVAIDESELPRLELIHERARANGSPCRLLAREELREVEPHAAGVRALHVLDTGIISYPAVCERLVELIHELGGEVRTGVSVEAIDERGDQATITTSAGELTARFVVTCAGLHSDRLARASGLEPRVRILPVRGEYYMLRSQARALCRGLIYPVPDPRFPFLGVHLTRTIDDHVECGPNAVLTLAREGYTGLDVSVEDLAEMMASGAVYRFIARHWRYGVGELWRSLSKRAFTCALRRLVPDLREDDLEPAPAGVRAQALAEDGSLVDDFLFVEGKRSLHVCNAPSPAATSSLSLGLTICEKVEDRLGVSKPLERAAV